MSQEFGTMDGATNQAFGSTGADIPSVDGEPVTAFVGPAPRGPVDRAVPVTGVADFDRLFGVPGCHCRMRMAVRQFFANGGRHAVVVRITTATGHSRIVLPTGDAHLMLEALNPGPLEFLRASVDYDGLLPDATDEFNLVIQRLRERDSVWIDEQECFRRISIDPDSRDFAGKVLTQSGLVRLAGIVPAGRPLPVVRPGTLREAGYITAIADTADNPPPGDYDFVGSTAAGTGLNALAPVQDIAHVCLLPGAADAAFGPVALFAADRFCRERQALLLIEPPSRWQTPADVLADQRKSGFASPNAVTWFPPVMAQAAHGEWLPGSAVGAVAATLAGEQRARAIDRLHEDRLTLLRSGLRLGGACSAEDRQRLARAGVNTLARRSALHLQLQNCVTQARHSNPIAGCDDLELRADILFLLRRIRLGISWAAGRGRDARLVRELHGQLDKMLRAAADSGLLASRIAGQGYVIRFDTPPAGDAPLSFSVGLALRSPGALLGFRFVQSAEACEVHELGWQAGFAAAVGV